MNNVGDSIDAPNAKWSFDGKVPLNFESHIKKSVPFYDEGHDLICQLSDFFVKDNSVVYDLGSSTGLLTYKLAKYIESTRAKIIGIESVPEMNSFSRKTYINSNLNYQCSNVFEFEFEESDMIISYYLLQFIRPSLRQKLLDLIYSKLNWGGAFICFEKVRACDARFQDITTSLYHEFKIRSGFSYDEILAKSRSLKGVLEPFSSEGNIDMYKRAGFKDILSIFKFVSFEGFLCIK